MGTCLVNTWVIRWGRAREFFTFHQGTIWDWLGLYLEESRRCASFGWKWGPKFVNLGSPPCPLTSTSNSVFFLCIFFLLFYGYVQDCRTLVKYLPPLFFQGLHLLQQSTSFHEEANHLEVVGLSKRWSWLWQDPKQRACMVWFGMFYLAHPCQ